MGPCIGVVYYDREQQATHVMDALQFKARTRRNALYEQDGSDDDDGNASQHSRKSSKGKKGGQGKSKGAAKKKRGKGEGGKQHEGHKQQKKKNEGKSVKHKHVSESSDEEEVQGPQLTNIMQIMEQQQRYVHRKHE